LVQIADDRGIFLSTLPATQRDRNIAIAVVAVSSVLFAIAVPFASVRLAPAPGFIAMSQGAQAINDVITAILLLAQFAILRSRGLLLLASGYAFAAVASTVQVLTFPGLFAPTGLLGAGPQTSPWLSLFWHTGFSLCVLGYALGKDRSGGAIIRWPVGRAVLASLLAIAIIVALLTWIAGAGADMLPSLILDNHSTPAFTAVVSAMWLLTLAPLLVLWLRRPHSVLDIWLMVVLYAWLFDIALSAIFNQARFDLGYYAGRAYGVLAASFVLAILLIHNAALQAQLSRLLRTLRLQAESDRDSHAQRERLFSAVVESSNDAIITQTLGGIVTGWNKAAERLFGFSASEAVGRHIDLIVPPDRQAEVRDFLARIGNGNPIEHQETVRLHKDSSPIEVSLSISPIRSATGEIVGASKIAHEVGERKRTQQALSREIEERQRIFETSQDLIMVTDTAGNFVQVSPSSMSILGYAPGEMIGHSAVEFIHPDDLESTRQEMRSARRGKHMLSFEARYLHKDGRVVTLNWMGNWSAPVRRYFFIGRDLTEKHAAEAEIRQAQKMDAIGQLTGGVAHDFNNILTVITGTIGILAEAVADRPDLATIARLIDDAAERGAQLTRHLIAFARKQPLQPRSIDVNALLLETEKLLRPTLPEQIEIQARPADNAWMALVDPNQLTTAILNLALNSRDAMPNGGKLVLETQNVHLDEAYAGMNAGVTPGDYVLVAVSDTGCGIAAGLLEKVFDPFFTTKEVGKGTGLGLSMVFGFVKQSGGHIKIYSEEGHGTSVKLYLPRAVGQDAAAEEPAVAEIEGGDEIILIVEDDALVRRYVVAQVASLGYTALEAIDAAQALKVIDGGADVDLLFTDVIMPGSMNGRQLADEAVKRRPALRTLFTSGYTEDAVIHQGRLDPGVLLLAKPYRKSDLARMIRTALAS
jgi:PAS domain S-box-containing protein